MRFARRDVRDHNAKTTTGLRSALSKHCTGENVQPSAFARFLEPLNFRLFQQYRREADIWQRMRRTNRRRDPQACAPKRCGAKLRRFQ